MTKRIGFLLASSLLAALVFSQDATSIARKPKAGQVITYQIHAEINIAGTSAVYTATSTEKVVEAGEDGTYSIESRQSELKVRYDNRDISPEPLGATRTKYAANGEVLDIISDMDKSVAFRVAAMTNIQAPGKAIQPGDKWSMENKPNANNGNIGSKTNYTFDKKENVGTFRTAVIKFNFTETSGSSPAQSEGTVWLNLEDGSLVKSEVTMKNAPFPGSPAPIDAKMTVTRNP